MTFTNYHIQIALNGREWLRRRLEARQAGFLRQGNKFLHIDDYALAQSCLDQQLDGQWPRLLDSFLATAFPTMNQTLGPYLSYYWTLWQSEWATDLIVDTPAVLTETGSSTMASILRHAWITGNSVNVLRYLGRPLTSAGKPYSVSNNEVQSRVLDFHDGVRVRHWVDHNSVKVYNAQNVLRVETTINQPYMFKVYRLAQGQRRDARKKLRPLRKGVADIPLRSQVSQEINNRLMDELSTFTDKTPLSDLLDPHVSSCTRNGRRVRSLDISGKDRQLLQAISGASFTVSGITNVALRQKLAATSWSAGRTDKQLSARVTRNLRLLRDHGLIRKVANRHRYHLTEKGRQLTTALHAMLSASTEQLIQMAA